jgi:hypothetical protein
MATSSAARQVVKWAQLAAILVIVLPVVTAAQEPVTSFDQLNTRLKVGDTVWVTDAEGREIKGRIRGLSATSLLLDAGSAPQDLQAARVRTIRIQQSDSLTNGTLIGLAVGAVAGALVMVPEYEGDNGPVIAVVWLGALSGAGVGALIDAARGGKKVLTYQAPGALSSSRLSIAPVITPRTKGVAVAFSF